jgi:hypothetical protein
MAIYCKMRVKVECWLRYDPDNVVQNDNVCCAERNFIKILDRTCIRKGIPPHQIGKWANRKYGELVIYRMRGDGVLGSSYPCVLCRQAIERRGLKWTAYDGTNWLHSTRTENLPDSIPTSRQKNVMFASSRSRA